MSIIFSLQRRSLWILLGITVFWILIWTLNLRYPLNTDSVGYATLSNNLFETGQYIIRGKVNDVFVPGHSILSYPFALLFGLNTGFKVASLIYGIGLLFASFFLFRRVVDEPTAGLAAFLLGLSFTESWLLSVGNADMLYGLEFFLCLLLYLRAIEKPSLFPWLGVLIGITLLTRYMGIALLPIVFLTTCIQKPRLLRSSYFWSLFIIALAIFSLWFLRNYLTFGHAFGAFHIISTVHSPTPMWETVIHNTIFYFHPAHSIGFLFPWMIAGLWIYWRRAPLLTIALPLSLLLCYVYPPVTSRFLVATIPLMHIFTAMGVRFSLQKITPWVIISLFLLALFVQAGMTCLYSLPQCSAFARQHIAFIPDELGFSQEGAESMQQAFDWIENNAPEKPIISSLILADDLPFRRQHRPTLNIVLVPSCEEATLAVVQNRMVITGSTVLATSKTRPFMDVRSIPKELCKASLPWDPEAHYW